MTHIIILFGDASFAMDVLCAADIDCEYINNYRIIVDERFLPEMEELFDANNIDYDYV